MRSHYSRPNNRARDQEAAAQSPRREDQFVIVDIPASAFA